MMMLIVWLVVVSNWYDCVEFGLGLASSRSCVPLPGRDSLRTHPRFGFTVEIIIIMSIVILDKSCALILFRDFGAIINLLLAYLLTQVK